MGGLRRWVADVGFARVAMLLAGIALVLGAAGLMARPGRAQGCGSGLPAGAHVLRMRVGRLWRSALVEVPPAAAAGRPVALVVALHGWGGSGGQMAPYSGFLPLASRVPLVVAYPSSHGLGWNITASPREPDDLGFLRALVERVVAGTCIAPGEVFATGVSNGGGMAALAGCALSEVFRAVAPVAGDFSQLPPCHPARAVSLLEIHGTADQEAAYFGRRGRRSAPGGVPPFVLAWARGEGCRRQPVASVVAARTRLFRWLGCRGGARVEHIQIRGGRHQWPGASPPDPGPRATICAACTIWRFFSQVAGRAPSGA